MVRSTEHPQTQRESTPPKCPSAGNLVTEIVVPGEGTWPVDTATGHITFTPEKTFTGLARTMRYTVKDPDGLTATGKVIVDVTPVIPQATNDVITPTSRGPVVINTLVNDAGNASAALDPASVQLIDPVSGALTLSLTVAGQRGHGPSTPRPAGSRSHPIPASLVRRRSVTASWTRMALQRRQAAGSTCLRQPPVWPLRSV